MKKLGLSGRTGRGKFTIVDDEDFEKVSGWKWQLSNRGYASRPKWLKPRKMNKQTTIYMHRLIMNFPDLQVDHINGNKLDNRKVNLRLTTNSQNHQNMKISTKNKSGYKGVCWDKKRKRWRTQLNISHIGYFDTRQEAALAYNEAAKKYYGEFAKLNQL